MKSQLKKIIPCIMAGVAGISYGKPIDNSNSEMNGISTATEEENVVSNKDELGNNDENKLTIKENTQNTGIINSLGKLEINTQDFENKGQIASIKDLKINSKNFTNNEDSLIFSNENVKFDLKNDFLNKGEIYSGKNIDIKALGAVTNNTATISAQNNIDINAKKITNIGKVEKKNPTIERKSALDSDTNITEKQREEAKKYFQELVNRKNNEKGIENPCRYTEGSYLFKDVKAEWI